MSDDRALRVHRVGEAIESRIEFCSKDDLPRTDLVLDVHYSSLNFKDALAVTGQGEIMREYPMTAGIDAAGVVRSSTSAKFEVGRSVVVIGGGLGETQNGGYASRLAIPHQLAVPLPEQLSLKESMILGTAGFTAALAIDRMQKNGQSVAHGPIFVTGASGGVGALAVNMLSHLGYEVVALSGKPELTDWLKELGAREVWDRHTMELGTRPLEKALWGGAIDSLGGNYLDWLCRTVKPWGNVASIGLAASTNLNTSVMPFILRGVSLLGINSVYPQEGVRQHIWNRLATDLKPPRLDLIHQGTLALEQVFSEAQRMLSSQTHGRWTVKIIE